jgi:hypothetical protein
MNILLLLIDIALDFAQSLIEGVLVTWLLIGKLVLQFFGVFLDVVVVVAH